MEKLFKWGKSSTIGTAPFRVTSRESALWIRWNDQEDILMRKTLTSLIYPFISSNDVLELRIVGTDVFEWYNSKSRLLNKRHSLTTGKCASRSEHRLGITRVNNMMCCALQVSQQKIDRCVVFKETYLTFIPVPFPPTNNDPWLLSDKFRRGYSWSVTMWHGDHVS